MRPTARTVLIAILALASLASGCAKKAPRTAADAALAAPATALEPSATSPREPELAVPPDPWSADLDELNAMAHRQGLLGHVFFDFDRYELRPEAREQLAGNARFLLQRPELVVMVEGHCDERGTNEYNLSLGERRAFSVKGYLVTLGVPAQRIRTMSYGKERPFCSQSSEECWAQNRRGHFVIVARATPS